MAKGTVYLINAKGTNRYKIGYTNRRFEERFAELSGGQAPYPLAVTKKISVKNAYTVEAALHQQFARFRKYGEWFEFDSRTLCQVCKAMELACMSPIPHPIPFLLMVAGILVMLFPACQKQLQSTNPRVIQQQK